MVYRNLSVVIALSLTVRSIEPNQSSNKEIMNQEQRKQINKTEDFQKHYSGVAISGA